MTSIPYDWAQEDPARSELDRKIDALIAQLRFETEQLGEQIRQLTDEMCDQIARRLT